MSLSLPFCSSRVVAVALAVSALACTTQAQTPLTTVRIAGGLTQPLCVTHAPGDGNRLFVLERTGRIKIVNIPANTVNATPFLDLTGQVAASIWLEYGLLGIAFHPDFQRNGFFYVNYTPNPVTGSIADTRVVRYRVSQANPDVADTATATTILNFSFGTRREHRAGWMDFGPDGYLYIATGDGGENDPDNAAQNTALLRGKILRLDVNGPDGIPGTADDDGFPADANKLYSIPPTNPFAGSATNAQEIWAYGLRNPWRCSFDRLTGDLWIGDVGQNTREEVDFIPAGSAGGRNLGWRCTEGTFCTGLAGCTCNGPTLTPPVYEYPHAVGLSVTGGYVYRGCAIPDLRGTYVFADYQNNKMFSLRYDGTTVSGFTDRTAELAPSGGQSALGEDLAGDIYICRYSTGEVHKLIPRTTPAPSLTVSRQPLSTTRCGGATALIQVMTTSTGSPASYRWQIEAAPPGSNIWLNLSDGPVNGGATMASGALSSILTLSNLRPAAAVRYRCHITNACAGIDSNPAALTVCIADFDDGSGAGVCDGGVAIEDLLYYLGLYDTGGSRADVDDGTGTGTPDGGVAIEDLLHLLTRYAAGC